MKKLSILFFSNVIILKFSAVFACDELLDYSNNYSLKQDLKSMAELIPKESKRFPQDQRSGKLFHFKCYQFMENRRDGKHIAPEVIKILLDPYVPKSLKLLFLKE